MAAYYTHPDVCNHPITPLDLSRASFPLISVYFLRRTACYDEDPVRKFLVYFRRLCSRELWWPMWTAIQQAHNTDVDSDDNSECDSSHPSSITDNVLPADVTGYNSDAPASDTSFDSNSDNGTNSDSIHNSDYDADTDTDSSSAESSQ